MDKKLNNLIDFKDFSTFSMKVENKPGKKIVEGLNNIKRFDELDESFFRDTKVGNTLRKGAGFLDTDEKWDKFWDENQEQIERWRGVYDVEVDENSVRQEAEKDNFQGVVGLEEIAGSYQVIYRPEGTFNWESPGGGIGK